MSGPRRRSWAALAGSTALAVLGLGPLLVAGGTPAHATVNLTETPVRVILDSISPAAPQPGDTLVVRGELQNLSSATISDPQVALQLGGKIGSRGAFDSYAAQPDATLSGVTTYTTAATVPLPTLTPDGSQQFSISVPVDNLDLPTTWQVNYLGISATGTTALNLQTVGSLRTFLPWAPRAAVGVGYSVPVAWIWPLVDSPHRGTGSVWLDDKLAPELAGSGRLSGLLNAGSDAEAQRPAGKHATTRNVPLTWAIDPMLISDAYTMASGPYQVAKPTASASSSGPTASVTGTGTGFARTWLAILKAALAKPDAAVLPLPFADPDINAAVRSNFATEIGVATTDGKTKLTQILGPDLRMRTIGWPPGGLATQRSINALLATGDTKVVLSDTALPFRDGQPSFTPSALTTFTTNDGQAKALLTDSVLDDDINDGAIHPDNQGRDTQRYLAETLMIQAEHPFDRRGVVLAPGRHWDPTPGYAATLLSDAGKVPWIQPVGIGQIKEGPADDRPARLPLAYPPAARRTELAASYLAKLTRLHTYVGDFADILPTNNATIRSYADAEQEALSAAWRTQPQTANDRLNDLIHQVERQMGEVHIASQTGSYVTLTSHGGKVPITIANELDIPVRVTVKLVPNQRLSSASGGEVTNQLIQPNQVINVDVHAAAKTSGVFPLDVQLYTPDGQAYGPAVRLNVRSTVYGTITLVITGAATAALMVAVAIRLGRRAFAARRRAPATP